MRCRLWGRTELDTTEATSEKAMAPHSSTLAWKIPWMEEPSGLQSMGSLRVRTQLRDFTFTFHFSLSCIGERNVNPLQCSCLENPRDGRAWWADVYGVTQSQTRLKRLSSSSRSDLAAAEVILQCNMYHIFYAQASLVAQRLKRLPPMRETLVRSLGREDPLEKEMVTHSSIFAWRIPWTEKPGRLQSTGSQRVGPD